MGMVTQKDLSLVTCHKFYLLFITFLLFNLYFNKSIQLFFYFITLYSKISSNFCTFIRDESKKRHRFDSLEGIFLEKAFSAAALCFRYKKYAKTLTCCYKIVISIKTQHKSQLMH